MQVTPVADRTKTPTKSATGVASYNRVAKNRLTLPNPSNYEKVREKILKQRKKADEMYVTIKQIIGLAEAA